ncbi:hypothetical protein MPEAHAMD_6210 [Methylobacterium frigidaeris]|uniref:Tyr recombinase domain-containing protein n=2 Tax=Methylobacterium frigidaeris TaxID=2038277 RepID=A0AA37HHQ9_9HYPH|nr:hypothetical protein MPEAHAMD_6210 [Methylobacterium frigidaeris]
MVGRHGKYLFKRSTSANWYLRLVYPAELVPIHKAKRLEVSLGTADRDEAMVRALPRIQDHKRELLMVRSMMRHQTMATAFVHEPGREYLRPDGSKIVATIAQLIHIDANGIVSKVEENIPREKTIWQTTPDGARALGIKEEHIAKMMFADQPTIKLAQKTKSSDLDVLIEYLRFKGHDLNGSYAAEARSTWEDFRAFSGGKILKECTRADGFAYVRHLRGKGLKTATIIKRINFLAAPINHANETGDLSGNPFFRVVDRKDDALERLCLSDADMKLCRDNMLPTLGRDERLMWLFLATTGMRHSEAYSIREEFQEGGIRYVRVGQKTEASKRRVPLPECLLPYLPKEIVGPIFTGSSLKNIPKNLLRALRRVGINDNRKVVYSLRHRAHTRLREVECPDDVQREIVGHETGEAHAQYGRYPIRVVKRWIDTIGY